MLDHKTTPLRERMIEDMRIKGLGESSRKHIFGRSDTLPSSLGDHRIPRPPKICAPISFIW